VARAPLVTDELPDRLFGRPLGKWVARAFLPTPVTANQVTVLATVAGVAAGVALWMERGILFAAAIALYLVLDCADGQLARMRGGGGNVWGRVVDGVGDYVTAIAIHLGLIGWLARDVGTGPGIAWGAGAGLSLAWASFLLDRYKRRYRGDTDDLEVVRRERDAARGIRRFLLGVFAVYANPIGGRSPIQDREAYQDRVRLPMSLWLVLGPTTHFVFFAVLAALGRPLLYAVIAVGPFNAAVLATLWLQVRRERGA
jgi:hypothetical protein